jgi:TonB family protein
MNGPASPPSIAALLSFAVCVTEITAPRVTVGAGGTEEPPPLDEHPASANAKSTNDQKCRLRMHGRFDASRPITLGKQWKRLSPAEGLRGSSRLRFFLLMALGIALALVIAPSARADTEYCPARATQLTPTSTASATFGYHIQALSARTIDATIVADTDRGWYTWNAAAAPLLVVYITAYMDGRAAGYEVAESPPLTVAFPQPLHVLRAWVVTATSTGDKAFGWDKDGAVACDVPDFIDAYALDELTTRPSSRNASSPPPAVVATPTSAPFPPATCAHPFLPVRIRDAIDPVFPRSVHQGDYGGRADVRLALAVDEFGSLTDFGVMSSSGLTAFDQATLEAAKASSYLPAVSYCRQVKGIFIFRATFTRGFH